VDFTVETRVGANYTTSIIKQIIGKSIQGQDLFPDSDFRVSLGGMGNALVNSRAVDFVGDGVGTWGIYIIEPETYIMSSKHDLAVTYMPANQTTITTVELKALSGSGSLSSADTPIPTYSTAYSIGSLSYINASTDISIGTGGGGGGGGK